MYVISADDWEKILRSFVGPANFALWTFDSVAVSIYKYDGTLQCGLGWEITLDEMEKELRAADIKVISKEKGTDGFMHVDLCGASTGHINIFQIDATGYDKAHKLGYERYLGPSSQAIRSVKATSDRMPTPWPFPW